MCTPPNHHRPNRGMMLYLVVCSTLILTLMMWQVWKTGTL